jgi:hypothetical protein
VQQKNIMQKNNEKSKSLFREIIIGLIISLILPLIAILGLLPYVSSLGISENLQTIIGLVFMWLISLVLILYITFYEKRSLKSVGISSLNLKQILLAVGLGIILSFLIPMIYTLTSFLFDNTSAVPTNIS